MNNNTEKYYNSKQGRLPLFISDRLDIWARYANYCYEFASGYLLHDPGYVTYSEETDRFIVWSEDGKHSIQKAPEEVLCCETGDYRFISCGRMMMSPGWILMLRKRDADGSGGLDFTRCREAVCPEDQRLFELHYDPSEIDYLTGYKRMRMMAHLQMVSLLAVWPVLLLTGNGVSIIASVLIFVLFIGLAVPGSMSEVMSMGIGFAELPLDIFISKAEEMRAGLRRKKERIYMDFFIALARYCHNDKTVADTPVDRLLPEAGTAAYALPPRRFLEMLGAYYRGEPDGLRKVKKAAYEEHDKFKTIPYDFVDHMVNMYYGDLKGEYDRALERADKILGMIRIHIGIPGYPRYARTYFTQFRDELVKKMEINGEAEKSAGEEDCVE